MHTILPTSAVAIFLIAGPVLSLTTSPVRHDQPVLILSLATPATREDAVREHGGTLAGPFRPPFATLATFDTADALDNLRHATGAWAINANAFSQFCGVSQ